MIQSYISRFLSTSISSLKKITPEKLKTKPKSASSQQWLSRQLSDPYVEKAKTMQLRCRSAFKLIEIDDRYKILSPGDIVVDCGAAPGSWTQVAVKRVNADGKMEGDPKGKVVAIDKQHVYPIEVTPSSQQALLEHLQGEQVHAVISDMAPKASGVRDLDNENMVKLCYSALRFAVQITRTEGVLLMKMWQCGETKQLESDMSRFYDNVRLVKPKSSRADSTEIFLLGRGFKGLERK
ncbi:unnamed protein product [Acanthoscelides obtectus]|uniref:rRNA methyltransferase 2, mitochondrial n=2 Tax=Acanthoscelides obtectus TaxID=200917 RepID=A0A9P0NSV2_ACAOB|nr:unnamed protein product [Acanthoscelides obtectus]CAK1678707.1 rRNA methyltransferase 2, mitochondrial [Acanthoscelides obtectus]